MSFGHRFNRFSGKAQVRRATLSCDSSYCFFLSDDLFIFIIFFPFTVSEMYMKPNLKRSYSENLNRSTDLKIYPPPSKKHHKSESSCEEVPEDLISLSLDLLNHIQQHENNSDTSGYVSSPSSASSHSPGPSPSPQDHMMTVSLY